MFDRIRPQIPKPINKTSSADKMNAVTQRILLKNDRMNAAMPLTTASTTMATTTLLSERVNKKLSTNKPRLTAIGQLMGFGSGGAGGGVGPSIR